MKRSIAMLWAAVTVSSATGLAWTAAGAAGARAEARRTLAEMEHAAADAGEITRLRAALPAAALDAPSVADLPARLTAVLASCGLAPSTLVNFEAAGRGAGALEAASLVLAPIGLPMLGRVLDAWRRREPAWIVTSIDLAPIGDGGEDTNTAGDVPLRAVLALERPVNAREGRR